MGVHAYGDVFRYSATDKCPAECMAQDADTPSKSHVSSRMSILGLNLSRYTHAAMVHISDNQHACTHILS